MIKIISTKKLVRARFASLKNWSDSPSIDTLNRLTTIPTASPINKPYSTDLNRLKLSLCNMFAFF